MKVVTANGTLVGQRDNLCKGLLQAMNTKYCHPFSAVLRPSIAIVYKAFEPRFFSLPEPEASLTSVSNGLYSTHAP